MPDYEVTSPDGKTFVVTAPPGASQEEVLAYAKANMPQPEEPGVLSKIGSSVSRVGANVIKEGLLGIPGLMGDLALKGSDLLTRVVVPDEWRKNLPPVGMPSEALDVLSRIPGLKGPLLPPVAPPEGFGEKLATAVGAGAIGGGVLGAATAPARISKALAMRAGAYSGAGAGAGGEIGAQVFPDQPLARLAGSLLGSVTPEGAAIAAKGLTTPSSLIVPSRIRGATGAITDPEWEMAKQNLEAGQQAGVRGMAAQAMPRRTPLTKLQEEMTAANPVMAQRLQDQQLRAMEAGQGMVEGVAPPVTPAEAALGAGKASDVALKAAVDARTAATKPLYAFKIPELTQDSVRNFFGQLKRYMDSVPELGPTTDARKYLQSNVIDRLKSGEVAPKSPHPWERGLPPGTPLYETTTGTLDTIVKDALDGLEKRNVITGEKGVSDHTAGVIRDALAGFKGYLDRLRVDPAGAKALHKQISEDVVQPQTRGLSGQVLGESGFNPNLPPDAKRIIEILLDPDKLRTSEIQVGARTWKASNPQAFPQLVRATIERKVQDIKPDDPNALTKFVESVRGAEGSDLHNNFRTMISEAAGPQALAGAERIMKAIEIAGKGRGGLGSTVEAPNVGPIIAQAAGATAIGLPRHALSVASKLLPGTAEANRKIVDLLSAGTPESLALLKEMSRRSPREIAAAITMGAGPEIILQGSKGQDVRAPEVTIEGTKEQ